MSYITGWYGRPKQGNQRSAHTKYNHVAKEGKPLCGYKPGAGMTMQFCAAGIYDPYVDCPGCKKSVEKERQRE